ncbi:DNA-binding protein [Marinomonas piezotolerans]|uniref:DNA-binding protein n=1 Tax=Marinomonas piezotolerans TaxID=2213058 RepID=A0A370U4P4_9GAMM|nr:helix-turn-helix domain-containing protein [Marinomonas piezotolerans]RDL42755.1 DNA-binding protein [Marinomonas piezotolerans]
MTPNNQLHSPIVTIEKFSDVSGLTIDTIRALISRGKLPTMKIGRRRMVNVALIEKEALSQQQ